MQTTRNAALARMLRPGLGHDGFEQRAMQIRFRIAFTFTSTRRTIVNGTIYLFFLQLSVGVVNNGRHLVVENERDIFP